MDDFTSLTYETKTSDDGTQVIFTGEVDETADFSQLTGLSGQVTFNLEEIERFNSEGIRRWVKFIRELEVSELILEKCSVPVVTQLNLIRGLKGKVWVKSFYIPYVCIESGEEELHLLHADDIDDPTNPPTPEGENGTLELDDLPERYFSFLKDFVKP
jgi:hypothetical protein